MGVEIPKGVGFSTDRVLLGLKVGKRQRPFLTPAFHFAKANLLLPASHCNNQSLPSSNRSHIAVVRGFNAVEVGGIDGATPEKGDLGETRSVDVSSR